MFPRVSKIGHVFFKSSETPIPNLTIGDGKLMGPNWKRKINWTPNCQLENAWLIWLMFLA